MDRAKPNVAKSCEQRLIITDIDGVLLNWSDTFTNWMAAQGYSIRDESSYSIATRFGISSSTAVQKVAEFNSSTTASKLPSISNAAKIINKLVAKWDFKFVAITNYGSDPASKLIRKKNMFTVFGETAYNNFQFIINSVDANKTKDLKPYQNSQLLWVEDNIKNCELGIEMGLEGCLINTPYNQTTQPIPRVEDWTEIYQLINDHLHG